MSVIRVLQVFTIMDRGGAETMIMNYYRAIDRSKVQFDFLVHRKDKAAFDNDIERLGGKIYRINPINPFFPQKYYNELRAFFRKHPEYTIIHSHLNTFSCFPLKIAREFNIESRIAHAHIAINQVTFSSFLNPEESLKEAIKKLIKLQLKKRVKNDATHLFSCGKKAGQWLFGDSPFITMNNAIDTEKFRYNKFTSEKYRKQFGLENKLVVGHIGRFVSQKNHSFLLKIFASILEKHHDSSLILIGDGPLRKLLEKEAEILNITPNIHFLGVRKDIPQLCQMMDVFIFPSFYEGLPVTLIEAQAAGVKVCASDSITKEVLLTKDIELLSLTVPPKEWASKILQKASIKRQENTDLIKEKGYDTKKNAEFFQDFYLNQNFK